MSEPPPPPFHVDAWAAVGPGWRVVEAQRSGDAYVDHRERVACVPAPTSRANRAVRIHEAVHALNGPQEFGHGFLSMMLEEVRTNAIAWHHGADIQPYHDDIVWDLPATTDRRTAALRWLQVVTSACAVGDVAAGRCSVRPDCPAALRAVFEDAAAILTDDDRAALASAAAAVVRRPAAEVREQQAALLDVRFPEVAGVPQVRPPHPEPGGPMPREREADGDRHPGQPQSSGRGDPPPPEQGGRQDRPRATITWQEWVRRAVPRQADLDLVDLTRHRGLARSLGRSAEPVDAGQEPVFWDHWATDQRIFDRPRPAGTLLVDCSGSMRWDWQGLRRRLRRLPATTVAGYSGFDGAAHLWIVAREARWVDADLSGLGPNNLADVEALEWLAEQPEPRVWVSDGKVNGGLVALLGSNRAEAMIRDLCRRHRIVRAASMDAALRHLRSGRRVPTSGSRDVFSWRDPQLVVFDQRAVGAFGLRLTEHAHFVE